MKNFHFKTVYQVFVCIFKLSIIFVSPLNLSASSIKTSHCLGLKLFFAAYLKRLFFSDLKREKADKWFGIYHCDRAFEQLKINAVEACFRKRPLKYL